MPLSVARLFAGVLLASNLSLLAYGQELSAFPSATSKKGLQVEDVDDAIALGVKHAAFNLSVPSLISETPRDDDILWAHRGTTLRINAHYLASQTRRIKAMTDSGALVYLIVLNISGAHPDAQSALVHPAYDSSSPNGIGAFNTQTDSGARTFMAAMAFLADHFGRVTKPPKTEDDSRQAALEEWPNGRVVGYIIGNEVNSHWWWYNMGEIAIDDFVEQYESTVRLAAQAIHEHAPWARVYLSLEHHWSVRYSPANPLRSFPARDFLTKFAQVARSHGDFDWHIAFHPYPENLFDPEFWKDRQATWSMDTAKITFKNLKVLSDFLERDAMLHEGLPRRIILSEQGFHTPEGKNGEKTQAAAYCYAYRIADELPLVDAFILHRHIDHPKEGGLALGLWRFDERTGKRTSKKLIYDAFQKADSSDWEAAFDFALPIVGLTDWENAGRPPFEEPR
ncbi:MAG TPA: hypothetical protein DDW52_23870 [Planctomycetaceae bacterium]|nr:hypothetical protein [Planctomycetaceae bacterium]